MLDNEVEFAPLCPSYQGPVRVVSLVINVIGTLLFFSGTFGFLIACSNVETRCNLTTTDDNCYLSLINLNNRNCGTNCPSNSDDFEENGWEEIKCFHDSNTMECPKASCPIDLFPFLALVITGLSLIFSSMAMYLINNSRFRVTRSFRGSNLSMVPIIQNQRIS
jgi:hypothetical protein